MCHVLDAYGNVTQQGCFSIIKLNSKNTFMEKVLFALDIDDGWPPVGTEGVWCEREGTDYKLVNTPFFIKGLAFGDVFSAIPDSVNEHIFEFEIVRESGHSVVWMLNNDRLDISSFIEEIELLGCRIEGLAKFSLNSIDVPSNINLTEFDQSISRWESKGLNFVFPTWRLEK
jgi:hypothetical protein